MDEKSYEKEYPSIFEGWAEKEEIKRYCKIKTESLDLKWVDCNNMTSDNGIDFLKILYRGGLDIEKVENVHIYLANFDLRDYFNFIGKLDYEIDYDKIVMFFHVSGEVDGELVSVTNLCSTLDAPDANVTAVSTEYCDVEESNSYRDFIMPNVEFYSVWMDVDNYDNEMFIRVDDFLEDYKKILIFLDSISYNGMSDLTELFDKLFKARVIIAQRRIEHVGKYINKVLGNMNRSVLYCPYKMEQFNIN